ncbi:MAG: acyl-CoA thioesterase [Sedimentisphaerales bacterium]|nr:acyl-CoA thioesterase [Sedimentisphaerales bacterium]
MNEEFNHYCIVRQEHLNQYGSLFGGHLLSIIDEMAYVACVRTFPAHNFVTRALQDVEFHAPARLGDVLETHASIDRIGRTSCQVKVKVFICGSKEKQRRLSFDGMVVMVCVDDQGRARAVIE